MCPFSTTNVKARSGGDGSWTTLVGPETIKGHMAAALRKLQVPNRAALVAIVAAAPGG